MRWPPLVVTFVGGDGRERETARLCAAAGCLVRAVGVPWRQEPPPAVNISGWPEALRGAQVVVGPVSGIDGEGYILSPPDSGLRLASRELGMLSPGCLLFVGKIDPTFRKLLDQGPWSVCEYRQRDDFAIYNSVASAEGALALAMEMMPVTVHGSRALVLGLGRMGLTLAWLLERMGARVYALARNPASCARAWQMSCCAQSLERLGEFIRRADVLFNTIPAPVVTAEVLMCAPRQLVIVDIASAPGGVDHEAARQLGLRTILAPGLPARVAPVSAGRVLFWVLTHVLQESRHLGGEVDGFPR